MDPPLPWQLMGRNRSQRLDVLPPVDLTGLALKGLSTLGQEAGPTSPMLTSLIQDVIVEHGSPPGRRYAPARSS